jgi:hypothetical protein
MTKKKPEDMTPEERKELKVEFAPGAFDTFDGTQEELDAMMAEIKKMVEDGTLFEKARTVDLDELIESDDPDDQRLATKLLQALDRDINGPDNDRNLQ